MRYRKRDNTMIGSNVTFGLDDQSGWSYGWWQVSKLIGDTIVFNQYFYGQATSGHQCKIRRLLNAEYKVLVVEAPDGLQVGLEPCIMYHKRLIVELEEQIAKPRTRRTTNERRRQDISQHRDKIEALRDLQAVEKGAA